MMDNHGIFLLVEGEGIEVTEKSPAWNEGFHGQSCDVRDDSKEHCRYKNCLRLEIINFCENTTECRETQANDNHAERPWGEGRVVLNGDDVRDEVSRVAEDVATFARVFFSRRQNPRHLL